MPQEQEVLHIHVIKLTLAARERKKNKGRKYIHVNAFSALHASNAFLFVPRDLHIILSHL